MLLNITRIIVSYAALAGKPLLVMLNVRHSIPYCASKSQAQGINPCVPLMAGIAVAISRLIPIPTGRQTAKHPTLLWDTYQLNIVNHSVYDFRHRHSKVNSPLANWYKKDSCQSETSIVSGAEPSL
jgi:hypothetical protein